MAVVRDHYRVEVSAQVQARLDETPHEQYREIRARLAALAVADRDPSWQPGAPNPFLLVRVSGLFLMVEFDQRARALRVHSVSDPPRLAEDERRRSPATA